MTKTYSTDPIVQEVCTDDMATIANDTLMRAAVVTMCAAVQDSVDPDMIGIDTGHGSMQLLTWSPDRSLYAEKREAIRHAICAHWLSD